MVTQTAVQSSHKESGNFSCSAFHSRSLVIASASSDRSLMKRADSARTLSSGGERQRKGAGVAGRRQTPLSQGSKLPVR